MKLEIKLLLLLVCLFLVAQPLALDARALKSGDSGYKDPMIALILGLILPGLGHIYIGYTTKGLIYLAIYIGIIVLFGWVLFWTVLAWGWWLGWLVAFAFGIWVAIDGMNAAKRYNERGGRLSMLDNFNPVMAAAH